MTKIITAAIVIAVIISYFIYRKHQQEETARYITGGAGAIHTAEKSSLPDFSKMSPVETAAWNGDYKKLRKLILDGSPVPRDLKIRITVKNTETVYNTKNEKDSGYVRYGESAVTHYRDKKTTVTSLEQTARVTEYGIVHYTAMEADSAVAEKLLKQGLDFTGYNSEGYAPVHIICQKFKYSERGFPYLKLLANYKINLNQKAKDSVGSTAIDIAEKRHDDRLVEYIKKLQP